MEDLQKHIRILSLKLINSNDHTKELTIWMLCNDG